VTILSRRTFLSATAVAAAGIGLVGTASAATPVPRSERSARAVVIGSGVGGSIAAARLAEAGVRTLVLERGKRWPITPAGDTFPPFLQPDRRSSYLTPSPVFPLQPPVLYKPYTGLFEKVVGQGMSVLCGAAVGGSTLLYAGVWIRPDAATFAEILPAVDYDELDAVHYPRAAKRVGIGTVPDDVLASPNYVGTRLFFDQARRAGLTAERLPNALNWDIARAELAGKAVPSVTRGEYFSGVNSGARNSMDRTYLADAERSGLVEVAPLHRVAGIATAAGGRYRIDVERTDTDGVVQELITIIADAVFLGAGSSGTSRLLVAARETGALPGLNDQVGRNWGNNGDRILVRALVPDPTGGPQGGPMAAGIRDQSDPGNPVTLTFGPAPLPFDLRLMAMPGFGACEPVGDFRYDSATGAVTLHWPADGDAAAQTSVKAMLLKLVEADAGAVPPLLTDVLSGVTGAVEQVVGGLLGGLTGGATAPLTGGVDRILGIASKAPSGVVDLGDLDPVTWHPLGGATLGAACDMFGRVDGHRGLYVTDASLIPGTTGACNPTWTIAALAERCLDDVVAKDVGGVF
jgi:cholesterol oxidase